jgi:hypothetical protein
VKQNEWHAGAAAIHEPQLHAGQFSEGTHIGRNGCPNSRHHRAQGTNKKRTPLDHVISPDIRTLDFKKVWAPGKLACW